MPPVLREPRTMKFRFIEEQRAAFPSEQLCRVATSSPSAGRSITSVSRAICSTSIASIFRTGPGRSLVWPANTFFKAFRVAGPFGTTGQNSARCPRKTLMRPKRSSIRVLHRHHTSRLLGQKCHQMGPRYHSVAWKRPIRHDRAELKAALLRVDRQHADRRRHKCALRMVAMHPSLQKGCRWVGTSTTSVQPDRSESSGASIFCPEVSRGSPFCAAGRAGAAPPSLNKQASAQQAIRSKARQ